MTPNKIAIIGSGFRSRGIVTVPREISEIAGPSCSPQLQAFRLNVFPATPFDRSLAVMAHIDAGIIAATQGADAVFLNTFGDYGLAELRSALAIPVVGAGESAMLVASSLGRRFSIVTIWPRKLSFIYDERIGACGMSRRCVSVRYVLDDAELEAGSENDSVDKLRQGNVELIDRVVEAANIAVRRDGADTIVFGCTCMSPIADRVAMRLSVPVVDAARTGYLYAETLVRLGVRQSSVAYPQPVAGRIGAVSALIDGTPQSDAADSCPVCPVGSS